MTRQDHEFWLGSCVEFFRTLQCDHGDGTCSKMSGVVFLSELILSSMSRVSAKVHRCVEENTVHFLRSLHAGRAEFGFISQ